MCLPIKAGVTFDVFFIITQDDSEDGYDDGGYDYSRKELKKELDDKFKSPEYREKMSSLFESLRLKK